MKKCGQCANWDDEKNPNESCAYTFSASIHDTACKYFRLRFSKHHLKRAGGGFTLMLNWFFLPRPIYTHCPDCDYEVSGLSPIVLAKVVRHIKNYHMRRQHGL